MFKYNIVLIYFIVLWKLLKLGFDYISIFLLSRLFEPQLKDSFNSRGLREMGCAKTQFVMKTKSVNKKIYKTKVSKLLSK